jgi:hypothetical protein
VITAYPVDPNMQMGDRSLSYAWKLIGDTYSVKDVIKSNGGYFDKWTRHWYMKTTEDLHKLMDAVSAKEQIKEEWKNE